MEIRKMNKLDWPSVSKIYSEGISTDIATFETNIPNYESWNEAHMNQCRLVAEENGRILGWAALSPVSNRCVYDGVAEVSVYVGENNRGRSIGKLLMDELILKSEAINIWTLQSGIFPENLGSIRLHEKVGFRYIGKRERIGKTKNGIWKDNLLFEKRSKTIGI